MARRVKSLAPNGRPMGADDSIASGYSHREHRSKKGREKNLMAKKALRRMLKERIDKFDRKYRDE
jgi:hypothetical protein